MSVARRGVTILVLGLGVAAGTLYWPDMVEGYFPGWKARTASVRAGLPFAKEAKAPANGGRAAGGEARQAASAALPPVPVEIDKVQRGPMALRVDAVGMAQPIATVALKTRIDAQIEKV